jgi:IMP dehydrogenase
VVKDPITVARTTIARVARELTQAHNGISGVPVVDWATIWSASSPAVTCASKPVSISRCRQIMTPKDVWSRSRKASLRRSDQGAAAPAPHREGAGHRRRLQLKGMITVKDFQQGRAYPNACKDEQGRLRVGAAVGTGAGTEERVAAW